MMLPFGKKISDLINERNIIVFRGCDINILGQVSNVENLNVESHIVEIVSSKVVRSNFSTSKVIRSKRS